MGSVHEAEQPSMRRRVALEIPDTSASFDPSGIKRFEREAWIVGRISHPNVVKVLDPGEDSACRWIARDVKPLNMLATKERDRLLLTGFGLARDPGSVPITHFEQYPDDFPAAIDDGGVAVPAGLAVARVLLDASPVTAAPGSRVRLPTVSGFSDHEVDVPLDWVSGRLGMAAVHLEGTLQEDDVPIMGHFVRRDADGAAIIELDMGWGRIAVHEASGRQDEALLLLSLHRLPLRAVPAAAATSRLTTISATRPSRCSWMRR